MHTITKMRRNNTMENPTETLLDSNLQRTENPLRELLAEAVEEKPATLADLIKKYQEIEEALIESGGLSDYGDQLAKVEGHIEKKLDACKGLIDYWKGQVAYLEEKKKSYKARKTGIKGGIDWLRGSMKAALLLTGKEKIKTPDGSYYFTSPRNPVTIDHELMTEKYARALQKTGIKTHRVIISLPAESCKGTAMESYAEELCGTIAGASWEVSEPEYDTAALAARYLGTNRKWPPYLTLTPKTFTIR